MQQLTLAFIGAGNMATALISGLLADGVSAEHITASDTDAAQREALAARTGIRVTADNAAACRSADVIVLAVKPQALKAVARDLAPALPNPAPLVISIAAGIRHTDLSRWLTAANRAPAPLIRCMPNTPAMIQTGATALFAGQDVSTAQRNIAESILRAVGLTLWVEDEALLDAVTALSGSGPAYVFLVMEAMEAAATRLGLDARQARLLTLQTVLGAARMAIEAEDPPATLRSRVTSPGGTTEQALRVFEEGDLAALFHQAMQAAQQRSVELSRLLGAS